jgi:hypothetical protein
MGLFLAWAIRRDLCDKRWFPSDHLAKIRARTWTGSDIADDVDGKLISDMFSTDGAEFATARYRDYLQAFGETFADLPDYGVADDASTASRIEPVLDHLYQSWIEAGRPAPAPPPDIDLETLGLPPIPDIPWDQVPTGHSIAVSQDGSWEFVKQPSPHEAIDVESLIPTDLIEAPLDMSSVTATHWGSSLLRAALRALQVRPSEAAVASAIGGSGDATLTVTVYRIPGIPADRLRESFASVIMRPGRVRWQERSVEGRDVMWAEAELAPGERPVAVAYWTRDGYVFHAAGQPDDVDLAVRRVGESLDA